MIQRDVRADGIFDLAGSVPGRNPVAGRCDLASVKRIRNQVATLRWLAAEALLEDSKQLRNACAAQGQRR